MRDVLLIVALCVTTGCLPSFAQPASTAPPSGATAAPTPTTWSQLAETLGVPESDQAVLAALDQMRGLDPGLALGLAMLVQDPAGNNADRLLPAMLLARSSSPSMAVILALLVAGEGDYYWVEDFLPLLLTAGGGTKAAVAPSIEGDALTIVEEGVAYRVDLRTMQPKEPTPLFAPSAPAGPSPELVRLVTELVRIRDMRDQKTSDVMAINQAANTYKVDTGSAATCVADLLAPRGKGPKGYRGPYLPAEPLEPFTGKPYMLRYGVVVGPGEVPSPPSPGGG